MPERLGWGGFRLLLHRWRESARQRSELSQMNVRDFENLRVPIGMAVTEVRKWPWQRFGAEWDELRPTHSGRGSMAAVPRGSTPAPVAKGLPCGDLAHDPWLGRGANGMPAPSSETGASTCQATALAEEGW